MCLIIEVRNPENVLAKGEHEGFEWVVVHNGAGYRCGYVRVPSGHPWHGKDYGAIDVEVHGGLTFSVFDTPCGKPNRNEDGYWIGFDCAHCYDMPDQKLPNCRKDVIFTNGAIRTQGYVEMECRRLAEQAKHATLNRTNP